MSGVEVFGGSRACFEDVVGWLTGSEAASLDHGPLEDDLDRRGRELLRRLLQDHPDLTVGQPDRCAEATLGSAIDITVRSMGW